MSRVVEGEYSRIPLHIMVEGARAAGVPFKAWQAKDKTLQLEALSVKRPAVNLVKLDELWSQAATAKGVVKNLGTQLAPEVYRALRRDYIHHSASHQGIANPPNISKFEVTVSKERRHIMGNLEG